MLPWSIRHRKGNVMANTLLTMLRQLAFSTLANYLGNIPLKIWLIKLSFHLFNSLITPLKCPTSPLERNSHTKKPRTEVHGMHSLLILNKQPSLREQSSLTMRGASRNAMKISPKPRHDSYSSLSRSNPIETLALMTKRRVTPGLRALANLFSTPAQCFNTKEQRCKHSTQVACREFNFFCELRWRRALWLE